tara:strand:- start:282 stop:425 length:144 start_codon:yes stop_codon:yes gene_type:complete
LKLIIIKLKKIEFYLISKYIKKNSKLDQWKSGYSDDWPVEMMEPLKS